MCTSNPLLTTPRGRLCGTIASSPLRPGNPVLSMRHLSPGARSAIVWRASGNLCSRCCPTSRRCRGRSSAPQEDARAMRMTGSSQVRCRAPAPSACRHVPHKGSNHPGLRAADTRALLVGGATAHGPLVTRTMSRADGGKAQA